MTAPMAMRDRSATDVNRQYYEQSSPGRDEYWRKMAAARSRVRVVLELVGPAVPKSLVDLGCGNGRLLAEIQRRYPPTQLTGIDLSERQIEANRAASRDITWLAADLATPLESRPDLTGRFDVVVASELVEHVGDPALLLRNARLLARRDGGRLLLSTQSGPVHETERRVGHVRHFSAVEMRELLERAGWARVRAWNEGFPFHDLSKWAANLRPDLAMAEFGQGRYGVTQNLVCWALRIAFRLNSRRRGHQLFAVAERDA
ncbi:MAG: class I SAM-dependent methyltransferase [Candidatus Rokubacteria bacterium]|nr:class I SAM-dependent methyltransferase [Candidatus Rokubacteria bacterium]